MLTPTRRIGASKLASVSEGQLPDGSLVAVKQYDRQTLSTFQHERLFAAANLWKSLSNPRLVKYVDVQPNTNTIIMELWDRSSAVRLNEGHSDPRLVLHVLRDVLLGLAFLHERGYLHANLKPSNVFFSPNGHALLSDGLLIPIHAPGTLPPPINQKYLTPEHTSDAFGPMSAATDLYCAGFLALELLAGDRFGRAFQGVGDEASDDDLAWFQWHGSSQVAPDATVFSKTCAPELASVIRRLLTKNPVERYRTAHQALQELPEDIVNAQIAPARTDSGNTKRELLATHVLERPSTGIVMIIASGPRAGEVIGTDQPQFVVGYGPDCFVRFTPDQYPGSQARVRLQRGPDGWGVQRESGTAVFVNDQPVDEAKPLRSGDILRLSLVGPDLQFTLQSGGVAVRQLVKRFLPDPTPTATTSANQNTFAPVRPAFGEPASPQSFPTAPIQAQPVSKASPMAPLSPGASGASTRPNAPGPVAPSINPAMPTRPTAPVAPQRPGQPSGAIQPNPGAQPVAPTNARSAAKQPNKATAGQVARTSPSTADNSAKGSLFQPSSWTKQQKNLATAIIGGLIVIAVVILIPTSESPKKERPPKSSEQGDTAKADAATTTTDPDSAENSNSSESNSATTPGDEASSEEAASSSSIESPFN